MTTSTLRQLSLFDLLAVSAAAPPGAADVTNFDVGPDAAPRQAAHPFSVAEKIRIDVRREAGIDAVVDAADAIPQAVAAEGPATSDRLEPTRSGGPVAGVPGEVSAVVAAARWGCSRDAVVALVRLGHLDGGARRVGARDHWHVIVEDLSIGLRGRVVALMGSRPSLGDVAAFRRLDQIRVKSGCEDLPVDDHWIESYFALPDRYVGHDHPQEIRGVLTAPDAEVSRVSRALQTMDDDGRIYADRVARYAGDLRSDLVAALGADVPPLEFTWLHPDGGRLPPVDEVAGARLLMMPAGRRRDRAIVHVATAAANGEATQPSVQALSHFRAATLLAGVGDDDPAVEARWTAFLEGAAMDGVGLAARVRTFHDVLACERTMCAYAEEPVSPALGAWLLANLPPIPEGEAFWDLVSATVETSARKGDVRRKARSDVISDAYDDHAAEAEAALSEARAMYERISAGHRAAGSSPAFAFSFPMPIRDEGRREVGATMMVDMVSVRADALLEMLLADARAKREELTPKSFLRRHAPGGDRYDPALARRRFAIYVGVEAVDPAGPPARAPSMIASFATGATLPPGMLPTTTLVARRGHLASRDLPIPALRPKGLVSGATPFDRHLMTWGLRSGLVIYPAEAFAQGCSIGALFYRMSVANQGRGGTAIQLVDDRGGFGKLPDETGRMRPTYRTIPKLGAGVAIELPLDDGTPSAFKAHIALTLAIEGCGDRAGADAKRLGNVPASADHPPSCGPARYGFQAAGRALLVGDVGYCLSHTFGRLVLTHDPRHSGANRRKADGESRREVADGLGNRSLAVSDKYARDTARQVKATGGGRHLSIRDAMAKLGIG